MFIVDGHCDTMMRITEPKEFYNSFTDTHINWKYIQDAGVKLEIMALFVEPQYKPYQSLVRTVELIGKFHQLLDEGPKNLILVKNKKDLEKLTNDNSVVGFLMALEGAEAITSKEILRTLFACGLRLVTLTWNQRNHLADGVWEKETGGGLTRLGKEIVAELNQLGIVVDVSHLSEKGFWDVVEVCSGPFVASHSNVYNIASHPRNLKDEQIHALVEKGGIIGINFCPHFLKNQGNATISDVMEHIDYIYQRWGPDNIALGSDFDGISEGARGLENLSKLPDLCDLLAKKFTSAEVEKIMGLNWKRLLQEILPSC